MTAILGGSIGDLVLPAVAHELTGVEINFRRGTVTGNSPLRVRLDGETAAMPVRPESLVGVDQLAAGTRVWVQRLNRRLIILGAADGGTPVVPDPALPEVSRVGGDGNNTSTATTFADLPTVTAVTAITNPHSVRPMLVMVQWGAWMSASANGVRCCPRASGAVTIPAGVGTGNMVVGWGMIPRGVVEYQQYQGTAVHELPPGTTTFTMQGMRESATGTQQVNYPAISLTPLRYT